MRVMAVIIAAVAALTHHHPTTLWNAIPVESGFHAAAKCIKEPPRRFMARTFNRFLESGSTKDSPYPKRKKDPLGITDSEAQLCAVHLKLGYWRTIVSKRTLKARRVHRYYPSIAAAVKNEEVIRTIKHKYGLTNKKLLYHMRKADPGLRRKRVHFKYGFDKDELELRVKIANRLWNKCRTTTNWLMRTYFIDECSIWIDNEFTSGITVWADAHDKGFQHCIHYHKLHKNKAIKVRFLAVVNAVDGATYLEFTTGTKDVERKHNLFPLQGNGPYKVGVIMVLLHPGNNYVAAHAHQNPKPWQLVSQQLCI